MVAAGVEAVRHASVGVGTTGMRPGVLRMIVITGTVQQYRRYCYTDERFNTLVISQCFLWSQGCIMI